MTQRELRKQVEELLKTLVRDKEVYQRQPWTFVLLRVQVNGELREIYDFAKVQYPDRWDAVRGIELAEQKALARLAKELIKEDPAKYWAVGLGAGVFVDGFLMDPINRM